MCFSFCSVEFYAAARRVCGGRECARPLRAGRFLVEHALGIRIISAREATAYERKTCQEGQGPGARHAAFRSIGAKISAWAFAENISNNTRRAPIWCCCSLTWQKHSPRKRRSMRRCAGLCGLLIAWRSAEPFSRRRMRVGRVGEVPVLSSPPRPRTADKADPGPRQGRNPGIQRFVIRSGWDEA